MNIRNILSLAACLLVVLLAGAYSEENSTIKLNVTLATSGPSTTTKVPAMPSSTPASSPPSKNSTGKVAGHSEEDCEDEEPAAEPEGTDRQGKQLHLGNDKDKYTHEGGKAEPESEPSGSASSGKLTGNATTTPAPAHGSAPTVARIGYTCGLEMIVAAIYLIM